MIDSLQQKKGREKGLKWSYLTILQRSLL